MLMVIFGAGASYDSVPSRSPTTFPPRDLPDRPPLANELFDDRPRFIEAISRFPQCQPIIPYLRHLQAGTTLERVLEQLQTEAEEYPERHKQLAAVRFYLHYVLWECKRFWNEIAKGVTNYKTLLDQLERWRKPDQCICLVTFNYDTMLEDALPTVGVQVRSLPDYISGDAYKVIKLHGSVNWAREVDTRIEGINELNVWKVAHELIDKASLLKISERYRMVAEHPIGKSGQVALFPAVAIPVERKRSYECPAEHVDALLRCLPEVRKLLVIGWCGAEVPFRELLGKNLRRELSVMVVAGRPENAAEPIQRLQEAGITGKFIPARRGFSEFIVRREGDDFLRG